MAERLLVTGIDAGVGVSFARAKVRQLRVLGLNNISKAYKFKGMLVFVRLTEQDEHIYVKAGEPILAYAPWYEPKVAGYEFGVVEIANSKGVGADRKVKFEVNDRVDGWVGDSYWRGRSSLVTFDSPVRRRSAVELSYTEYGQDRERVVFPEPHSTRKCAVNGKLHETLHPVHAAAILSGKLIYATVRGRTEVAVSNDADTYGVIDLSGIVDDEYEPPAEQHPNYPHPETIPMAVTGDMKFSRDGKKLFVAMRGDPGDKYVILQSTRPLYIAEVDVGVRDGNITASLAKVHKLLGSVTYGARRVFTAVVAWDIPKSAPYLPIAATVTTIETEDTTNDNSLTTSPTATPGWLSLSSTQIRSSEATASVSLAINGEVVFWSGEVSGTNTTTHSSTGTGYYDEDDGHLVWWTSSTTTVNSLAVRNHLLHIRDIDVVNKAALVRLSTESINHEGSPGVEVVGDLTIADVAIAHGREVFRKVSSAVGGSLWASHTGESVSNTALNPGNKGATARFMHDHSIHKGGCIQVLDNKDVYFTVYTEMLRNQFLVFGAVDQSIEYFDDPSEYRSSYWVREGEVYRHQMRDWTPQNDPPEKFLKGGGLWFAEFDTEDEVYLPAVKMNEHTAVSDNGEFMFGRLSLTLPGKHKAQKDQP